MGANCSLKFEAKERRKNPQDIFERKRSLWKREEDLDLKRKED